MAAAPDCEDYVMLLVKAQNETKQMKDVWKNIITLKKTYIFLDRR